MFFSVFLAFSQRFAGFFRVSRSTNAPWNATRAPEQLNRSCSMKGGAAVRLRLTFGFFPILFSMAFSGTT